VFPVRYYVVALVALLLLPTAARADGDPASDILYFTDVFTSFDETSKPLIANLRHETEVARAQGRPIKVAVVWTQTDLGAVPQLFNKPDTYAKFLGAELSGVLTGPLLIVMPSGFGVYSKHGNVQKMLQAVEKVPVHAATVDELTQTATVAVQKLRVVLPRKADARAPNVRALAGAARLGTKTKLRFRLSDNSGQARALVRVYGTQYALYATLAMPLRKVGARGSVQSVRWRVPKAMGAGKFRFCVLATDKAGNASKTSCAKLVLKKP
jgi:hypothetical protein